MWVHTYIHACLHIYYMLSMHIHSFWEKKNIFYPVPLINKLMGSFY